MKPQFTLVNFIPATVDFFLIYIPDKTFAFLTKFLACFFMLWFVLNTFKLHAQCTCTENTGEFESDQLLLCENFESYTTGSNFPANNPKWAFWPGTTTPAKIQVPAGPAFGKALYIQENGSSKPDLLLKLGNKSSGRYRVSWQMYIPKGKTAYYNFQHLESASHWAFGATFDANGIGTVNRLNKDVSKFSYLTGAWNNVMHIVDFNADELELWINDEFVDSWKFSLGNGLNAGYSDGKLGAINFYAPTNGAYFVDNICMWQPTSTGRPVPDPVCIKNGKTSISPLVANRYELYTSKEFEEGSCASVCDYWNLILGNADSIQEQITTQDFLPNSLLTSDCLLKLFPGSSKKQINGKIYARKKGIDEYVSIFIDLKNGIPSDMAAIVYDCERAICIEPISKVIINQRIVYTFEDNSISSRVIILSSKPIEYNLRIYSRPFPTRDCPDETPVACNCLDNALLEKNKPTNLVFKEFDNPGVTYKEFNVDINFEGKEAAYFFILKKRSLVNLQANATGNGLGMFLYGYYCVSDPIASSVIENNGGTGSIQKILEPGKYHVYFDLIQNKSGGSFTLNFSEQEVEALDLIPACPVLSNTPHLITIRSTPLLLDNVPMSISDRIIATSLLSDKKIFEAANWNGIELKMELEADDPLYPGACGFVENEEIGFEIIRGNNIIPVRPVFQNEDQATINAKGRFKKGGKSLITGFYSKSNVGHIGIGTFPRISAAAANFRTELSINDSWQLTSRNVQSESGWVKVYPSAGEKGFHSLVFVLEANPFTQSRRDTITITDAKGNNKLVILEQPGCTGPSVNAGVDQSFCGGQNVSLIATGSGIITWQNPGIIPNPRLSTTLTSTQTFTAYATLNGCTASDQVTIDISPKPTANAGLDKSICAGAGTALLATGGSVYRWSTNQTSAQIEVTPGQTTTYTVTITLNGCEASDQVVVFVNQTLANAGPDQSICSGKNVTLSATGGNSYRWSNNVTTASMTLRPASSQTYNVTVTQNGCQATDQVTVTVKPTPIANAGPDQFICQGAAATLIASGGGTYGWSTGSSTARIGVTPTSTQTYRVTVSVNGCDSTDAATVFVNPNPTVTLSETRLVFGPTGFLKVQVSNGTPDYRFQWFRNDTLIATQKDLLGLRTGIYKLLVTDANGCTATLGPQAVVVTATNEAVLLERFEIFPNPTKGQVFIQGQLIHKEKVQVLILDATGRYIWKSDVKELRSFEFSPSLHNFEAGVYFIQVQIGQHFFHKKLILL